LHLVLRNRHLASGSIKDGHSPRCRQLSPRRLDIRWNAPPSFPPGYIGAIGRKVEAPLIEPVYTLLAAASTARRTSVSIEFDNAQYRRDH